MYSLFDFVIDIVALTFLLAALKKIQFCISNLAMSFISDKGRKNNV